MNNPQTWRTDEFEIEYRLGGYYKPRLYSMIFKRIDNPEYRGATMVYWHSNIHGCFELFVQTDLMTMPHHAKILEFFKQYL